MFHLTRTHTYTFIHTKENLHKVKKRREAYKKETWLTQDSLNILLAMMLVLSNMFLPGPEAKHISFFPGQVYCFEQLLPENSHFGPRVLGETSPRLLEAKAATNGPWSQPIFSITILEGTQNLFFTSRSIISVICTCENIYLNRIVASIL